MFPQLSHYSLLYPLMLFGLVAPKLKEMMSSQDLEKRRISVLSQDAHDPVPEEKVSPGQIVDEIAQKVLAGMPLRLINLNTGTFSSSSDLFRSFKSSHEYQALISDKSITPDDLADKAEDVIRKYFAYAMLSHVWGEDEPLYGEVKLIANILDMTASSPGTQKLQNFCRIAKEQGFHWCWSDTCCIDKMSSAELQESINSMFTWYRNSALTIAFLLDVLQSTPDALKRSRWFTRGWTLQELLAPRAIQFYKGNWTPFLVSDHVSGDVSPLNYKLIPEFVQSLENILGIDKSDLVDFNPGLDDVRERLRWMATRQTTKAEDMAYCLLGILDLRLPVLYGEGERSFIRLQDEIMKNTDDTCIFDWVGKPSNLNSYLARSPSCFRQPSWHASVHQTTVPLLDAVSDFTHKISASLMRLSEALLDDPPLGHFIANGRMNLRTFVYQIRSVEPTGTTAEVRHGGRKETVYFYNIKAYGLEPVMVATTHKLPDKISVHTLSITRVWDNALRTVRRADHPGPLLLPSRTKSGDQCDAAADDYNPWPMKKGDNYTAELARRLREPFVAQLLFVSPDGQFRRIHTEERIVAQPLFSELLDLRTPRTLIVH